MTGAQLGLDFEAPRLVRVTPARLGTWSPPPPLPAHLPRPARSRPERRAGGEHVGRGRAPGAAVALRVAARAAHPGGGGPARGPTLEQRGLPRRRAGPPLPRARPQLGWPSTPRGRPRSTPSGWSSGCRWRSAGSSRRAGSTGSTGGATSWWSWTTRPAARPPRRTPASPAHWRCTRSVWSARCGAVASRGSCTTCPAGTSRGGGTTGRRWRRTSRRRERSAAALAVAAEELAAGADPEARFPARPAPRCGSCDVRRHCPEGRAAAPESEPWAQLSP